MATLNIPWEANPNQTFLIDLDSQTIRLRLYWNATTSTWYFDMEGITFDTILNGIAMVIGVDLLAPYAVRELGQMWIVDMDEKDTPPDFDQVGDRFQFLYVERGV